MTKLSELEGAVLGLIDKEGPLTAYAVRSHFQKSRSSHFSGSAGAIYPLINRLLAAGLLTARERARGKRASRVHGLTGDGKRALRSWLTPLDDAMAAVEFDPIRTRVHFLAALSPAKRTGFLIDAADKLKKEIAATEALVGELDEEQDPWSAWGARGALAVLRARLEWIESIRR